MGNVLVTISDRKITASIIPPPACTANYDMQSGVPGGFTPQDVTLSTTGGQLVVTRTGNSSSFANTDALLLANIQANRSYRIDFDFDPGNMTSASKIEILVYEKNNVTSTYNFMPTFQSGPMSLPAGHYNFIYTPAPGWVGTNINAYITFRIYGPTGNYIKLDNLTMCGLELINEQNPDVLSHTDYFAFGQTMPGRTYSNGNYRYGFNGKENDNEVKGTGNQQDYGMRIYDPRLGRFLSVDPIAKEYPELTPYQFAGNTPIQAIDLDGLEPYFMFGEVPPTGPVLRTPIDIDVEAVAKIAVETAAKTAEVTRPVSKAPKFTREQFEAFKRGIETEKEQLNKAGLEKNTKPFTEEVNGDDVTTIPDGVRPGGGTVEIKNVQRQSFTKQLRAQEKISNKNGAKPELIINKDAKLSNPLKKSSFDIKFYQTAPATRDNTNIPKVDPLEKMGAPESDDPCKGNPNCI